MKRVVCISDTRQDDNYPKVEKGKIYVVYNTWEREAPLLYYFIIGMPSNVIFRSDMFLDIVENQIEETVKTKTI